VYRLLASVDSFEGKVNDAAKNFDAARDRGTSTTRRSFTIPADSATTGSKFGRFALGELK
jgi:hypothetical protein